MEVFCVFLVWMEIIDFPMERMGLIFGLMLLAIMHANEGLFSPFLRAKEGQEPGIGFFAGIKEKR
jgi:hypothetical protein